MALLAIPVAASGQAFTDFAQFRAAAGAPAFSVNADDLPHDTTLTTQYPGIDFASTTRAWDAIRFGGGGTAVSPPNVLFNFGTQPMRWSFTEPAWSVGVWNPSIFDRIRLTFLRADDTVIATIDMNTGAVTFAGFIAGEPIAKMTAEGIAGSSNGTIFLDNLEWSGACPRIVSQPVDRSVCPGGDATFTIEVGGLRPLAYQWRFNATPIDATANPSAASPSLVIADASPADQGVYDCVVTGAACPPVVSDAASLSVCAADFNCDGTVNSTDVSDFINAWFEDQVMGTLLTDWDHNGVVNSTDVSAYINAWFEDVAAGCGG